MKCIHCRREIPEDAFFCPYCGLVVSKANQAEHGEKLIYGQDLSKGKPSGKPWREPEEKENEAKDTAQDLDLQLRELGKDWDEEHQISDSQEWDEEDWEDSREWTGNSDWARKQNIVERKRERPVERKPKKSRTYLVLIGLVVFVMLILICAIWLIFSSLDAREQRAQENQQEELQVENQEEQSDDAQAQKQEEDTADIEMHFTSEPKDLGDYYRLSVEEATATSQISQEGTDNGPDKMVDGNEKTSWQEGAEGDGIGESVQFRLKKAYRVKYMSFQLGNWNSQRYYDGNNRPKELEITVGNVTQTVTFPDGKTEYWLEFSRECPAEDISLTIKSVYSGDEWDDTCIAEVGFYGVDNSN